jgi:hypothetical protein
VKACSIHWWGVRPLVLGASRGGDDNDYVVGGGFGSQLYGGAGADLFGLADNAFVMDATKEDYAIPFVLASKMKYCRGHSLWMSRSPAAGAYA